MAYSTVYASAGTGTVDFEAIGGTRRQRGAAIAVQVRKYPGSLERVHVSYSETYGFQTATYARYRII